MQGEICAAMQLASRIKHQSIEFRELRNCADWERELAELLIQFAKSLKEAIRLRVMPEPILNALEISAEANEKGWNLFWEAGLANSVLGYAPWGFDLVTEPAEYDDVNGCMWGGDRHLCLKPGYISLTWPSVFDDIYSARLLHGEDLNDAGKSLWDERRYAIFGYYAKACELLAEWIENHADDDRGNQPGDQSDQNVDPFPNDGLDKDGKAFEWGGRRFDQLTGGMMRVLELLHDERKKGHPNVPSAVISRRANVSIDSGVKSQVFKVNRKDWPVDATGKKPLHPVSEIVIDNGDGTHRLIDPVKVPAKVPAGS